MDPWRQSLSWNKVVVVEEIFVVVGKFNGGAGGFAPFAFFLRCDTSCSKSEL